MITLTIETKRAVKMPNRLCQCDPKKQIIILSVITLNGCIKKEK
jgi:hypothetical protein